MPRFAANLSLLYTEHPFLDRAAAAAADGFAAVECQFPYEQPAPALRAQLDAAGVPLVLMNAPPGDWAGGERGLACLPGRDGDFRRGIERALEYAQALACPRLHVMAGCVPPGTERPALQACYVERLAWAAEQARPLGIDVLIEPINQRDMPGYFLNRQDHGHEILALIGAPNLKVQMDLYHCQIVEGDVAMKLRQHLPGGRIGHLQIAGVPERNEPDRGELDYRYLLELIDELGYAGWVGCEYRPRGATRAGLGWRTHLA